MNSIILTYCLCCFHWHILWNLYSRVEELGLCCRLKVKEDFRVKVNLLVLTKTSEVRGLEVFSLAWPEAVLRKEVSTNRVSLTESFRGHFSITLSEKIFSNQTLNMTCVARSALYLNFMSRSCDPVLSVLWPISKHLFVDLISGCFFAVDFWRHSSTSSESSEIPSFSISFNNSLVDWSSGKAKKIVFRRNVSSITWQVLFIEASVLGSVISDLSHDSVTILFYFKAKQYL